MVALAYLIAYVLSVRRQAFHFGVFSKNNVQIIVAFVVVLHLQCLVSVYLSLVNIKYSVCVWFLCGFFSHLKCCHIICAPGSQLGLIVSIHDCKIGRAHV